MKKILVCILALILVISAVPLGAFEFSVNAEETTEYTEGYYTYTVTDEKATIVSVDPSISGDVTLPVVLGEYVVEKIGDGAFAFCTNLVTVTISSVVNSIGNYAFFNCDKLKFISFQPIEMEEIGYSAFNGCVNLERIVIPNGVSEIKDATFFDCHNLKSIFIPNSITNIGNNALLGCSLEKIYYNGTKEDKSNIAISQENDDLSLVEWCYINDAGTVGECAWYFDSGKLIITGNGNMGQYSCEEWGVIGVTHPSYCLYSYEIKDIVIEDGVQNIAEGAFANEYPNIRSVTIPHSVTTIGYGAFMNWWYDNTDFSSIIIPETVTKIDDCAFVGCNYLTISCKENSCAQKYAIENDIPFVLIKSEIKTGDLSGDEKINNKDLGLLMQKLNGWDVAINEDAADVNADGKVNNKDYGLLMQYCNGWNVELK